MNKERTKSKWEKGIFTGEHLLRQLYRSSKVTSIPVTGYPMQKWNNSVASSGAENQLYVRPFIPVEIGKNKNELRMAELGGWHLL